MNKRYNLFQDSEKLKGFDAFFQREGNRLNNLKSSITCSADHVNVDVRKDGKGREYKVLSGKMVDRIYLLLRDFKHNRQHSARKEKEVTTLKKKVELYVNEKYNLRKQLKDARMQIKSIENKLTHHKILDVLYSLDPASIKIVTDLIYKLYNFSSMPVRENEEVNKKIKELTDNLKVAKRDFVRANSELTKLDSKYKEKYEQDLKLAVAKAEKDVEERMGLANYEEMLAAERAKNKKLEETIRIISEAVK